MAADGPKFTWTGEQQRGIQTVGRSLLVSAAAGSGKTAVLAERCAYLVCDAPPPHRCDVDELLVVTFTRAAADEMRVRIERAVRQRLAKASDERLTKQLMLLDRAHVSTLHSFCTSVLRRHFNLVGLDPNFRTLDEDEALLMRLDAARQLLADRYETDAGGEFQRFIDRYADGDDERIVWHLIGLQNLLCSVIDPEKWLADNLTRIEEAIAAGNLEESCYGRAITNLVRQRMADLRRRCIDAAGQFATSEHFSQYVEVLNDLIAGLDSAAAAFERDGFDGLAAAARSFSFAAMPRMSSTLPGKEEAKKLVDGLRTELKEGGGLYELCRFTAKDWVEGLERIREPTAVLIELVRAFSHRYEAAKREVGALDFNDLERLTLSVLRGGGPGSEPGNGDGLAPSGTARAYHAQFKHVLVDEYQDINETQDAILTLVSRECVRGQDTGAIQNLFCVGDVKQSIYRFRLADPQQFLDRNKMLRECGDPAVGEVIDLQSNFRSRAPLLEAINRVFERLMTERAAEIEYDDSQRLRPGANYPPPAGKQKCFAGAPIELHLLPPPSAGGGGDDEGDAPPAAEDAEQDLDRTDREAALVARRIRELMAGEGDERHHVLDKTPDGEPVYRPIRHKDIVILLRATQHKSEQFAAMLRMRGIPVHSDSGSGFFDTSEIRDMLALLALVDNQQQDIPLAAVLRSPLAGLAEPEDGLARIRLAYPGSPDDHLPFHRAVVRYAREKDDELAAHLRDFLARLAEWRETAHRRPLAELLWTVYDSTGYLAFCAGLKDGEQRVANLVQLHERARQFGSFQRQGVRRFIQFLETLRQEKDLALPSVSSRADDVVRVMSIHRSKGLEFPVVIVPDLGKKHNLQETAGSILVDRAAGLGLMCVDEERRIRYPSMAWAIVQERIRRQSLAEELRVLYVAMTRAREHLILVGTCKAEQMEKWTARWSEHEGPLPPEQVLRGNSLLDWIGPACAATAKQNPRPIDPILHDEDDVRTWSAEAAHGPALGELQQALARLEPLAPPPPAHGAAEALRRRLTDEYAHRPYTRIPASQTVGSLTKEGRRTFGVRSPSRGEVVTFEHELPAPRCVLEQLSLSPVEIGSATHLVLQHLDFARPCTREDVKQQIHDMISRKLVPAAEAQVVDVDAIRWLLDTPPGRLLEKHARDLRRELPVFYPNPCAPEGRPPSEDPRDRVMVRGRIDVMIPDDGGLVLIDYKTDRVTPQTLPERAEFYRPQVESYARALAGATGRPVAAAHLVFLAARQIITIVPPAGGSLASHPRGAESSG